MLLAAGEGVYIPWDPEELILDRSDSHERTVVSWEDGGMRIFRLPVLLAFIESRIFRTISPASLPAEVLVPSARWSCSWRFTGVDWDEAAHLGIFRVWPPHSDPGRRALI